MDAGDTIIPHLPWMIGGGLTLGFTAITGWIATTWLRIRHGYPLENSWGKAIYPQQAPEALERVKLLTQENAQLRAELGAIRDRLQTVERIVTDSGNLLSHEIDRLRDRTN
jgi:hypothetical protein